MIYLGFAIELCYFVYRNLSAILNVEYFLVISQSGLSRQELCDQSLLAPEEGMRNVHVIKDSEV